MSNPCGLSQPHVVNFKLPHTNAVHIPVQLNIDMHMHMHMHIQIHVHMQVNMDVDVNINKHVQVHLHVNLNLHLHMHVTMGSQSNLNETPRFSFQRALIRSDLWSQINRSKQIILLQMDFGC